MSLWRNKLSLELYIYTFVSDYFLEFIDNISKCDLEFFGTTIDLFRLFRYDSICVLHIYKIWNALIGQKNLVFYFT